jgi:hypothetical protein
MSPELFHLAFIRQVG